MIQALQLYTTKDYNGIEFDCYIEAGQQDKGDFWATREQIGRLLGYENPVKAISNLHERNSERLSRFSTILNLRKVEGGREVAREVTVYSFKGLLEICRYSNQPKANAVMDWLFDVADEIRCTGNYSLKHKKKSAKSTLSLGSMMDACEKIYDLALHCESNDDVQKVLALDEAFKRCVGESALEIGRFSLKCDDKYDREVLSLEFTHPELRRLRQINERIREEFSTAEYLNLMEEFAYEGTN